MNDTAEKFRINGILAINGNGAVVEVSSGNCVFSQGDQQYLSTRYQLKIAGKLEGYECPFSSGYIQEKDVIFSSSWIDVPRGSKIPSVGDAVSFQYRDGFGVNGKYCLEIPSIPISEFQTIAWNTWLDSNFNII